MIYHRVCNKCNTMGATFGAGTPYPSGSPKFITSFWWGSCCSIFSFQCNVLWIVVSPFVVFILTIVQSFQFHVLSTDLQPD